jgi:hypothetical protein
MVSRPDRGIHERPERRAQWRVAVLHAAWLATALAGCQDSRRDAPTAPTVPQPTLSGRWAGVVANPLTGAGRLSLTIDERPVDTTRSALLGTWRVSFDRSAESKEGTISGFLSLSVAEINLYVLPRQTCSPAVLPFSIAGDSFALRVETTPALMTGTATYFACTEASDGTVELSRQ